MSEHESVKMSHHETTKLRDNATIRRLPTMHRCSHGAVRRHSRHTALNRVNSPPAFAELRRGTQRRGYNFRGLAFGQTSSALMLQRFNGSAAFSLLEVVLALGVAAFCLIAVLGLLPVGVQTNRNASSQTAVSNIIATVVSDLRTTPAAATTSPEFAITFDAEKTLFFDASGKASPSLSADSRYRLNVTWNSAPTGLHYAVLKATWPAEVDPATTPPGGSVEIFAAFDRN